MGMGPPRLEPRPKYWLYWCILCVSVCSFCMPKAQSSPVWFQWSQSSSSSVHRRSSFSKRPSKVGGWRAAIGLLQLLNTQFAFKMRKCNVFFYTIKTQSIVFTIRDTSPFSYIDTALLLDTLVSLAQYRRLGIARQFSANIPHQLYHIS